MAEPKRIISTRIVARRLGIARPALAKYIRREQVRPDFESDAGSFFDPARLPELKQAIEQNRQRTWRHIGAGIGQMNNAWDLSFPLCRFHRVRFLEAFQVGENKPLLVFQFDIADARMRLLRRPVIERTRTNA
jgi:hypothetical protein